ncbi:MAG: hypothetical protein JO112_19360 [Planctomycetes bacterium]|nr:hypothetical protein [Planctomycetota bacterium]
MAIGVRCPACAKQLRVQEEQAGKRVKCPACGQILRIAAPRPASSAQSVPGVPTTSPAALPPRIPRRRRARWPWLVGGLVLAVAVLGLVVVLEGRTTTPRKNRPESLSPEETRPEALLQQQGSSVPQEAPKQWASDLAGKQPASLICLSPPIYKWGTPKGNCWTSYSCPSNLRVETI